MISRYINYMVARDIAYKGRIFSWYNVTTLAHIDIWKEYLSTADIHVP